jgi:hypothetical protein
MRKAPEGASQVDTGVGRSYSALTPLIAAAAAAVTEGCSIRWTWAATPKSRPRVTGILATTLADAGSIRLTTPWFGCVAQIEPSPAASHHDRTKLLFTGCEGVTSR